VAGDPRSRKNGETRGTLTCGTLTSGPTTHLERFWSRRSLVTDKPRLIFLPFIHDRGTPPVFIAVGLTFSDVQLLPTPASLRERGLL